MALPAAADPAQPDGVDCDAVAWMDESASAEDRAKALVDASTQHQIYRWLAEQPANAPQQTDFDGVAYPAQVPCTPEVVYTDGPDGVRFTEGVTAFPAPISLASTWNTDLAYEKGQMQAQESFDSGKNGVLGPGLASGRTPLSGRTPEYFGEDPVLTGQFTAASVDGLHEGDPRKPVLSDLKHYIANEQELDRETSSSNIEERAFHEIYALPFEIALADSEPSSVMCSYNQIGGVYGCENALLNEHLKGELDYDGYVVSDFGAVHSTAEALMNGLDQELNRPIHFTPEKLDAALAAGEVTQDRITSAATRVIAAYIRSGVFDTPLSETPSVATSAENKAVAREIAEQGSVLLKNDGMLPLDLAEGQSIAVFGPAAAVQSTEGVSASSVCSMAWAFGGGNTLTCEDLVAPLEALEAAAEDVGASVVYNPGTDLEAAADVAQSADVAIVFGHQRMGEFSDLDDLSLQDGGDALISAVAAVNDSTVVVLNTGSAVEMPWLDSVRGVFAGWLGGEQFGPAITALLTGEANPSGKLPMTFPRSLEDVPTQTEEQYPGVVDEAGIRQVDYSEGLEVGYRWYESQGIEPLFGFGYGLSYSEFEYSKVRVTPRRSNGEREMSVRFRLTNTSDVAGTEVAQVYVTLPDSSGEPSKRLIAFKRLELGAGEHQNVSVRLSAKDLATLRALQYWDEDVEGWVTPSGEFTVEVGGSIDADHSAEFVVR
ncbi:glycoside hydrolase family 3 C-terminal domain-containing protein [Microbacterium sp. G2-8]|uniref:beta-glucosidase n=1 Tax=Microbacterium sp. G2-8 TaxID=2842454 RepID=UPI001C8A9632|nr:glycoside hydrolase family 3 C-terminal domain-containing protein [Microbacterium sp. G2-8]